MTGVLEKTTFERWLKVSPSSIYTLVKALENNLRRCLESEDANYAAFDVGMLYICHPLDVCSES
jgi:hypothetical protein